MPASDGHDLSLGLAGEMLETDGVSALSQGEPLGDLYLIHKTWLCALIDEYLGILEEATNAHFDFR